jgi:hypothetical protein
MVKPRAIIMEHQGGLFGRNEPQVFLPAFVAMCAETLQRVVPELDWIVVVRLGVIRDASGDDFRLNFRPAVRERTRFQANLSWAAKRSEF